MRKKRRDGRVKVKKKEEEKVEIICCLQQTFKLFNIIIVATINAEKKISSSFPEYIFLLLNEGWNFLFSVIYRSLPSTTTEPQQLPPLTASTAKLFFHSRHSSKSSSLFSTRWLPLPVLFIRNIIYQQDSPHFSQSSKYIELNIARTIVLIPSFLHKYFFTLIMGDGSSRTWHETQMFLCSSFNFTVTKVRIYYSSSTE